MRKNISLIITVLMLCTTAFASTPSNWALETVDTARETGILDVSEQYSYTAPINREDFCTLAMRTLTKCGITTGEAAENPFTDTENEDVVTLYNLGVINGKSETTFAPYDNITREEAAAILHRMCKTLGVEDVYFDYRLSSYCFYDRSEFSEWATEHIYNIYLHGIMTGVGNDKFAPKEFYTTEQAVATMVRLYNKYCGTNVEYNLFEDKINAQMPRDENYMFSPLSVKMALAMAANGADGETQKEILEVTDIEDLDQFNTYSKGLIESYPQTDFLNLNISNSVWINTDKTPQRFSTSFQKTISDFYDGDAKTVNNSNAVKTVNNWASEKTGGKITEILDNTDFWMMLVNAVYFRGVWTHDFYEDFTLPAEFTNADGTRVQIDFMNQTQWLRYYETDDVKIVEMPYLNELETESYESVSLSMYLVLSDEEIPVNHVLNEAVENGRFSVEYVNLSMPKFKIEYSTSMKHMLENMGMTKSFTEDADFEKMFDRGNMWLWDVMHKTYISVDEKGTEAAAVTVGGGGGSSYNPEPVKFELNKPFTFVIMDNINGEILFMGRYAFAE